MTKRHIAELSGGSDVEQYHIQPTGKRPRVDADSGQEDALGHAKNVKGKSRIDFVMREEEDDAELDARLAADLSRITNVQGDAETEAEDDHGANMRGAMPRMEGKKGGIAQMGIIESIEMHHFMCHRRLSVKFGPKVNFIIGHNGSGKSAILSGIMIALGAKAIYTGRGNGLKSFIREGQSIAEVTIGIKNQGDEPFKSEVYGETIYVTRRFTKEGSSSYKIKNASGKIISTKRDELSVICDYMNIQVDNPMSILTQDSARQFLSNSHPTDKYQFFMKGTQLTQLREEYETCFENIQKTSHILRLKREETPELQKAFDEADARNNEANMAREKEARLKEYRREKAWALVKVKEAEMTRKIEESAKARRRLPKIEEAIVNAEAGVENAGSRIAKLDTESKSMADIGAIEKERDELNAKIKHNRDDIRDYKAGETEMNQEAKKLTDEINSLEQTITDETAKLQDNTQEVREESQRKLEVAEGECNAKEVELRSLPVPNTLRSHIDELESQGKQAESDIFKLRQSIEAATSNIQRCHKKSSEDPTLFGRNLPAVLSCIQKERWIGEVPVGPFGKFVSVRDSKWAQVMRTQLGSAMSSFVVTDNRDRYRLQNILNQHGNNRAQIVVSDVDLFDYSRGEPPEHVTTVLRALDIKHEFVKRILINISHIEKVLLADNRSDGDQLLVQLGGARSAWTADGYIAHRYSDGGAISTPMYLPKGNDPRLHMFAGADRTADINRWEQEKDEAERRLQDATSAMASCMQSLRDDRVELQRIETQEKALIKRKNELKLDIIRFQQEVSVDIPIAIESSQQAKEVAKEGKQSIEKQYEDVLRRRMDLDTANRKLLNQREGLEHEISEWQSRDRGMKTKIGAAMQERVDKTAAKTHWETKLVEAQTTVAELEAAAEFLQTEFTEWSAKAEKIGPQFENPHKPEVVSIQIESIEKALHDHERRQGATSEEIAVQRDNAKDALDNHTHQIDEISKLNQALRDSLFTRAVKWSDFRSLMAMKCKFQFQYHLWTRGYFGKLFFNHDAGTLNLKVQTDDRASTQSKDKDPKVLSGGEKSYSTICLLLALWQTIQCPIRCLDEFDVFMDSVNRRISMKMMVETASDSDKQHILITPQDDPELNQNQLPF